MLERIHSYNESLKMAFAVEAEQPAAGGFCEHAGCMLGLERLNSVEIGPRVALVLVRGRTHKLGTSLGARGGECPP